VSRYRRSESQEEFELPKSNKISSVEIYAIYSCNPLYFAESGKLKNEFKYEYVEELSALLGWHK
jgi:hypothetical protein